MADGLRSIGVEDAVRIQILGPLRLWRDHVELDPGPRQQAYLLAVLLAQAGRPVGTAELIDLVWGGDAPPSALNVIQKYVGALRRLLEPALPAREAGSYLLRHGTGYVFKAIPEVLDLVSFRALVDAGRAATTEGHQDVALARYLAALGLWLVRESVASSTPRSVVARLHLHVADAVQDDAERLAHHLWAAGPLADPARTVQALVRAARRAANMAAFEAANRHLEIAAELARSAGLPTLELSALSLLAIVIRRMARYAGSAFEVLERAENLARRLGRDAQAADFLYIRWIASAHAAKQHRDELVHRLRDQGEASADPLVRACVRPAGLGTVPVGAR